MYWIENPPQWLNEVIPYHGKYYVVYPPMPAIVLIPFVYLFGESFPQQLLAHLMGAGIVVFSYNAVLSLTKVKKIALWSALLIGLGSIVWYLSATGSVWYLGQVSAAFFMTAALYFVLEKKFFLSGLFLGASYLSRVHTIAAIPVFLYLSYKHKKKSILSFVTGVLPFLIFNALYNYVRFGVPWDIGYKLIPGVLEEPWYQKGLVHPSYILSHLKIMFLALPKLLNEFPYIQPSWAGLAIWITTPAFVFCLFAPLKQNITKFLWLSLLLVSIPVLMHGGTGFTQFGYRYAVDFYPLLLLLTALGVKKTGLKKYHWVLLIIGVIVNLWGVLWINKFGWISY